MLMHSLSPQAASRDARRATLDRLVAQALVGYTNQGIAVHPTLAQQMRRDLQHAPITEALMITQVPHNDDMVPAPPGMAPSRRQLALLIAAAGVGLVAMVSVLAFH